MNAIDNNIPTRDNVANRGGFTTTALNLYIQFKDFFYADYGGGAFRSVRLFKYLSAELKHLAAGYVANRTMKSFTTLSSTRFTGAGPLNQIQN